MQDHGELREVVQELNHMLNYAEEHLAYMSEGAALWETLQDENRVLSAHLGHLQQCLCSAEGQRDTLDELNSALQVWGRSSTCLQLQLAVCCWQCACGAMASMVNNCLARGQTNCRPERCTCRPQV